MATYKKIFRDNSPDQSNAIPAFAGIGVQFTPEEARIIERLTDMTTIEQCIELGAAKIKARLWVHRERISTFANYDLGSVTVDDFEEDIVVFNEILIQGEDGLKLYPYCYFSYQEESVTLPSEGARFGMVEAEYVQQQLLLTTEAA